MTRDEALALLPEIVDKASDEDGYVSYAVANCCEQLRTYILNSIPTPKVEVEGAWGMVKVNGDEVVYEPEYAHDIAHNLRAALGIGGAS